MSDAPAATPPPAGNSLMRVLITALAGASIEWYDFFIYGTAAALVFPKLFFPADLPPLIAQLAAFSTFAVGFIARPIGGVIFGHFGDRVGRKRALVTALVAMGCATTLVGLLPSYAQVGIAAPLALILLRFTQGLAVGGQWGGAMLLAFENAPKGRRGFYSSFAQVGVPVGVVLANLIFLVMTAVLAPAQFQAWGWRIPFLLSVALVGLGLYVQIKLEDTPEFKALQAAAGDAAPRQASPILQVLLSHPRQILLAGGAFIASNGCFYVVITYSVAYGVATLHMARGTVLTAVLIASLVMIPLLPIIASLSDRWGRRGLFMAGAALSGLWAFAFFPLLQSGSFALITLGVTVALGFQSLMYAPQAALFAELFTTKVRYSGASLGYQVGAIFGGGFAPIIATALFAQYKSTQPISLYMAILCAISLVCVFLLAETHKREVDEVVAA